MSINQFLQSGYGKDAIPSYKTLLLQHYLFAIHYVQSMQRSIA